MNDATTEYDLLFSGEYPAVARSVLMMVQDATRAETITQDAFVQLLRRWRRVARAGQPEKWVRLFAIKIASKAERHGRLRSLARRARPPGPTPGDGRVPTAIRDLPLMERVVLVLFLVEDRSLPEVVHLIGGSSASARHHLLRAREHLASALGDEDPQTLDARVREALERSAPQADADAGRALSSVRRRTGRVVLRRRAAGVLALGGLALAAVVLGPRALDTGGTDGRAPAPSPSVRFAGFFNTDLAEAGEPLASAGLSGRWMLAFRGDGQVGWRAPRRSGLFEGLPLDTFEASGRRIVTNLFSAALCDGGPPATYAWSRVGSTLTFVAVDDTCELRRAVLTTRDWAVG